jgi:hypothetical protein
MDDKLMDEILDSWMPHFPVEFDSVEKAVKWVRDRVTREAKSSSCLFCGWSKEFNCYFLVKQEYGGSFIEGDEVKVKVLNLIKFVIGDDQTKEYYLTYANVGNFDIEGLL